MRGTGPICSSAVAEETKEGSLPLGRSRAASRSVKNAQTDGEGEDCGEKQPDDLFHHDRRQVTLAREG
jgi:hypothetical protein